MKEVAVHRARLGWSQKELAERAGVSVRTVRRAETGDSLTPESLERLFVALAIDPSTLEDDEEAVKTSLLRIEESSYTTGITLLQLGIVVLLTLGMISGMSTIMLLVDGQSQRALPFYVGSSLAPVAIFLFIRYLAWQARLARELEPDCDRLIRAIGAGRLRVLDRDLYSTLVSIRREAFDVACNSKLASVSILHSGEAFGILGDGVRIWSGGGQRAPVSIGDLATRKEIAWRAGVDPRTLRRLENGEPVSSKVRRAVGQAVTGSSAERLEQRYSEALGETATAFEDGHVFWGRFSGLFLLPASVVLSFFSAVGLVESIVRTGSPSPVQIGVFASLLGIIGLAVRLFRRGRLEHRRIAAGLREAASLVLDGIRVGAVRHLSARQYGAVATTLGERDLVEAMEVAPAPVRVL